MAITREEEERYAEDLRFRLLRKHDFFGSIIHRTKINIVDSIKALTGVVNAMTVGPLSPIFKVGSTIPMQPEMYKKRHKAFSRIERFMKLICPMR